MTLTGTKEFLLHDTAEAKNTEGFEPRSFVLSLVWFSSISAHRSASIDMEFVNHIIPVGWNDHSAQSLGSLVNVGAFPIARVSTIGAAAFSAASI